MSQWLTLINLRLIDGVWDQKYISLNKYGEKELIFVPPFQLEVYLCLKHKEKTMILNAILIFLNDC
jgi:hypothetical protein